MLNILNLIDDARCFETVRAMRWPQGVTCPHCDSPQVTKQGHDESQPERQKDNRCQFIISGTFRERSAFLDGFAGQARFDQPLGCRSDHPYG